MGIISALGQGIWNGWGTVVKESSETVYNMIMGWKWLAETEVLVGIPEEKSQRKSGSLSNAQLMYIHTNGSPANHLPARPVIEPALAQQETRERIQEYLREGAKAALFGHIPEAQRAYQKAGQIGANAAVEYFTSGNLAPLSPYTIALKAARMKGKNKSEAERIAAASRPLIDTGALRQSVTYVVRKKK